MRLKDFWATAVRRWYLVLFAILVSAAATVFVVLRVGPTYTAEGSALVFPPASTVQRDGAVETVGNPYLNLQGVILARDIVIRALSSNSTRDELAETAPGSTFEATPDFVNSAPIILVSVEADSPEEATSLLSAVIGRIPAILTDLQTGLNLADDALITSKALIADSRPEPDYKNLIRAGIAALVATLGVSLLAVGMIDGLLSGRRQNDGGNRHRRKARLDESASDSNVVTPQPGSGSGDERQMQAGPRRLGMRAAQAPVGGGGLARTRDGRGETSGPTDAGDQPGTRPSVGVNGQR